MPHTLLLIWKLPLTSFTSKSNRFQTFHLNSKSHLKSPKQPGFSLTRQNLTCKNLISLPGAVAETPAPTPESYRR